MADQGIVAIYELRRRGNSSISASRAEPDVINGNNIRCGVLDHILGLWKEQPAREPKGKNPAGVGIVVLTLTASYGIGRLFGVSHHLATLKRRRLWRGHRWQLVHDRPEPSVGFGVKAAVPSRRDEIVDRVIAGIAQGSHQGFRLVEIWDHRKPA